MSIGKGIVPQPAHDLAAAERRFAALAARDDASISDAGRSRFLHHGAATSLAVVLIHGLTNAPQQWVPFATDLQARGHSVVIPRLPGHGKRDRSTTVPARVAVDAYLATTSEAIDIASGAGARVVVAGLSIGGAFAAWHALQRPDVARAIVLVPLYGLRRLPLAADRLLATMLGVLPNAFMAWDPRGDGSQIPAYGYPRFATRALAATLRIGLDVERASHRLGARGEIVTVLNEREPAIDNGIARAIADRLERRRPGSTRTVVWSDLPAIHDIIDPTNPHGRTDLVYPRLRAEIER
ncbi:MAG: hypothetical protein NVSMB19_18190 [Vulcanimicrobiaceae bacterium]